MTLLNQIIAVEAGAKSTADKGLDSAYHAIQKDALFSGIARTYDPKDDEGDKLPPESTKVQANVEDLLILVSASLSRWFDVRVTKDLANTEARGDVIVDGKPLLVDVPVTYLIFLEKQLVDLRTFVSKLPLLDPAEDWTLDGTSGVYANQPSQTTRSKKVPQAFVKYPATNQHPAQVEVVYEDVIVGYWTTKKFSGRIPQERQKELLDRIAKLDAAVKMAREKANSIEITDRWIAATLFGYLFAG